MLSTCEGQDGLLQLSALTLNTTSGPKDHARKSFFKRVISY